MKRTLWTLLLIPFLVGEPPIPLYAYYFPFVSHPMGKAGLAWAYRGQNDVSGLGISFYHDWLIFTGDNPVPEYERVEHLACRYWPYDGNENTAQTFYLADLAAIQPYSDTMLFMNEPDLVGQCNMTPRTAVTLFIESLAICPTCRFTLPQVSHRDYLAGWPWIRGFITAYQEQTGELPPASYGSFHLYGLSVTPALDSYEAMLLEVGYTAVLPILITETGACTPEMAVQMLAELEGDSRVERYFWYTPFEPGGCSNLFTAFNTNELTAVGRAFKEKE